MTQFSQEHIYHVTFFRIHYHISFKHHSCRLKYMRDIFHFLSLTFSLHMDYAHIHHIDPISLLSMKFSNKTFLLIRQYKTIHTLFCNIGIVRSVYQNIRIHCQNTYITLLFLVYPHDPSLAC